MRAFRNSISGVAGVAVTLLSAGCNTSLLPQSAIGTDGTSNNPANEASSVDALNAVVSGDVAAAFRDHVAALDSAAAIDDPAASVETDTIAAAAFGLSDDERARIEALQMQLDGGEITVEAFATQVDAILGDRAPDKAFGGLDFFGSPFGDRIRGLIAAQLGLTDEQLNAAREIFENTHRAIRVLRITALANIRMQLTDEQRAKLDVLRDERFASIRDDAPVPPGAFRGRGFLPGRPGERRGHDAIRERVRGFFERLADALGVTDEQRTAIQAIRDQLRADVRAAHQRAREAFKALLTAEQLATLEQLEARIQERVDQHDGTHERGDDDADERDDD